MKRKKEKKNLTKTPTHVEELEYESSSRPQTSYNS